jgi:hypothetical protein
MQTTYRERTTDSQTMDMRRVARDERPETLDPRLPSRVRSRVSCLVSLLRSFFPRLQVPRLLFCERLEAGAHRGELEASNIFVEFTRQRVHVGR